MPPPLPSGAVTIGSYGPDGCSALDDRRVHPDDLEVVTVRVEEGPAVHEVALLLGLAGGGTPEAIALSTSSSTFSLLSALSARRASTVCEESAICFLVN